MHQRAWQAGTAGRSGLSCLGHRCRRPPVCADKPVAFGGYRQYHRGQTAVCVCPVSVIVCVCLLYRGLLRSTHQRAGLELMDQMAAHQEAAYEHLCRCV